MPAGPGGDDAFTPRRRLILELEDVTWLTAHREQGWSVKRIAAAVDTDPTRVRKALRGAGLSPRLERARYIPELTDAAWLTERRHDGWGAVRRIAKCLHADDNRMHKALRDATSRPRLLRGCYVSEDRRTSTNDV